MKVVVWSKYHCPQCETAKSILTAAKVQFEERKIGDGYTREDLLEMAPTARSVPQFFVDDKHIGGLQELKTHLGLQ